MMTDWCLPSQNSVPPRTTTELVLLEYDGPQLVLARGPGGLHLGVAADEDSEYVRWIFAPLSDIEMKALADGVVATDLFLRPGVHVVDIGGDEHAARAGTVDGESVPDAAIFEELARAGDDPDKLATLLARVGPRVQGRYDELLESLARHHLVLLSRRRGGGALLSGHAARRVRAALPKTVVGEPESFPALGHFEAYDTAGKFSFFDDVSNERYDGNVLPSVLASTRGVTVGASTRYFVSIHVTTYAASGMQIKQTYALAEVVEVNRLSPDPEEWDG